jgi:hypothetical protein
MTIFDLYILLGSASAAGRRVSSRHLSGVVFSIVIVVVAYSSFHIRDVQKFFFSFTLRDDVAFFIYLQTCANFFPFVAC